MATYVYGENLVDFDDSNVIAIVVPDKPSYVSGTPIYKELLEKLPYADFHSDGDKTLGTIAIRKGEKGQKNVLGLFASSKGSTQEQRAKWFEMCLQKLTYLQKQLQLTAMIAYFF